MFAPQKNIRTTRNLIANVETISSHSFMHEKRQEIGKRTSNLGFRRKRWECDKRNCHFDSQFLEFARVEFRNNRKIIPKMFPKTNLLIYANDAKSNDAINPNVDKLLFCCSYFMLWWFRKVIHDFRTNEFFHLFHIWETFLSLLRHENS